MEFVGEPEHEHLAERHLLVDIGGGGDDRWILWDDGASGGGCDGGGASSLREQPSGSDSSVSWGDGKPR